MQFLTALFKKKRRGTTLVELIVSMALFTILLAILVTLISVSSTSMHAEKDTREYQQQVDNFVYNLLIDMKSSYEVFVDGDTLTIYQNEKIVYYEIDNLKGIIRRDGSVACESFYACYFIPIDSSSVILRFSVTDTNTVEYTMRCGVSSQNAVAPT